MIKLKLGSRLSEDNLNRVFKLLYQILEEDSNDLYINVFYVDEKKTDLEPIILQALSRGTFENKNYHSKVEI